MGLSQTSEQLFERALRHIPGGVNSPVRAFRAVGGAPFFVCKAKGAKVWDVEGKEYIDYVCTWGPAILGHAPEVVVDAIRIAAENGTSFGIPNPYEVEMAELICQWVPSVEKVRMCNSGTEATMSCIRLARGYTGRDKIIKFTGCYHGHVDALLVKAGSGALTLGQPDSAGIPAATAADTITVPFHDREAVASAFEKWPGQIAAIILEPVPANCGLILPDPTFLTFLRETATAHGTVLIFDEVMTGFRLGKDGAQGRFGIRPDLSAFGKVSGGGLPVGAFGGRKEIMDTLAPDGPVYQAGTLSGNPLAMAAGLAQLKELEKGGFEKLEQLGAKWEETTRSLLAQYGRPWKVYRIGSMFCLYFTEANVRNLDDAKSSDTARFRTYFHQMLGCGIYIAPSQFEAGFLSTAHDDDALNRTAEAFERFLKN